MYTIAMLVYQRVYAPVPTADGQPEHLKKVLVPSAPHLDNSSGLQGGSREALSI